MRGAVGYEPRVSSRNLRGRQESSGSKADFPRERGNVYGLSVSLKRRQAWHAALENERLSTKAWRINFITETLIIVV